MLSGTQRPTSSTVSNLQVSDWVNCVEETGAYYQLFRNNYKLVKKKFGCLFCQKKYADLKKFCKIYYSVAFKNR